MLATQDPVDGFRGQAVQCCDRKFEVVFAGVLNLVMADTAERLYEHHDRRNASAGDFGGIVEGPRGHLVRSAANLTNGLLTQVEKIGVKGNRRNYEYMGGAIASGARDWRNLLL